MSELVRWHSPTVTYVNGAPWEQVVATLGYNPSTLNPAKMWRTQPHLRVVVDFLARNVAQLGLHVYERMPDGGRVRADDSALAQLLRFVDGAITTYDLVYATVGDFALYDAAYWWLMQDSRVPTGYRLLRLPPTWVSQWPGDDSPFFASRFNVAFQGKVHTIPASIDGSPGVVRFGGYSPTAYIGSSSKVEALKATLLEQIEAARYRSQIWENGGRVSAVLERPVDAEPWSDRARDAFREDWYAKYTGKGPGAGGTPILEDGMKLTRVDFNAREQQFVEAAKLSLQTVASVYHVNPTMIGYTDGATYSNVREFSRMLYTDTLGPILRQVTERINKQLLPVMGLDPARFYAEFNIAEKLAGSFEEQAAVLSSSVGAPWLTPNEARARQNLPAIEGGDQLVVPLNVTVGGQASPRDSGTQNETPGAPDRATAAPLPTAKRAALPPVKSRRARTAATDAVAAVLAKFFEHQHKVLRGKKDKLPWDSERWDKELTADLLAVSRAEALRAATDALKDNGLGADAYDEARTVAYLTESSARKAEAINEGTRKRLQDAVDALDDWDDEDGEPPNPYDKVLVDEADGHAHTWGAVVAGFATGFGITEAARQNGGKRATKTWIVTSANPRESHAAMDGETVPIDDTFSNGLDWPASFGDPDEVAGCQCEVAVSW
ncbi:phage portal protein [Atopobiaceae bacterium HCP3S3_F7]